MAIKQKIGKCIDCPADAADQAITAKRCRNHYWRHRQKLAADKPKNIAKRKEKKVIGVFFASEVLQIPLHCEECGGPLPSLPKWQMKAMVCHILPKAIFKSVAIHPKNKWFGCIDCHTDFDNRGSEHVTRMKLLPVLKERVAALLPYLTNDEYRRIPEYLL